jgi:formylglycine-generating enzyme required for sulfatase activity
MPREAQWFRIVSVLIFALTVLLSFGSQPACSQDLLESLGLRFRRIPGGVYFLGSPLSEPGRFTHEPQRHPVTLTSFFITDTEITNAQYRRFLKATGHQPPLYGQDKNLNGPTQPVVGVTFEDAVAFTRWLTQKTGIPHRLPSEAEWEAAARGGLVGQLYPWGSEPPEADGVYRANYYPNDFGDDGFRFTAPVGSFPPTGYGLFDLAGNVAEWCQEPLATPSRQTSFDPRRQRVLKGGSWYSRARELRCAARQFAAPDNADGFIGFRVVRLPPAK